MLCWLRRHPALTLVAINLVLLGALAAAGEIALRLWVPYDPGYYVVLRDQSDSIEYPWGIVKRNSAGFADDDLTAARISLEDGAALSRGVAARTDRAVSFAGS